MIMGKTDVKNENTKETVDDPTRTTESTVDTGGNAVIGGNNSSESKLVSQPGAKKVIWRDSEL
jgi:hypothetical protein